MSNEGKCWLKKWMNLIINLLLQYYHYWLINYELVQLTKCLINLMQGWESKTLWANTKVKQIKQDIKRHTPNNNNNNKIWELFYDWIDYAYYMYEI